MSISLDHLSPLPARRWRVPPLIQATLACHGLAGVVALARPDAALWAGAAVLLNHLAITVATVTPRSQWLGRNVVALPPAAVRRGEVAITIDDGPDPEVTPRVLDLLDQAGVKATFFCIAEKVARHPLLAREIVARGHDLQNHSSAHRHTFAFLGPNGYAAELAQAQQTIETITGHRPRFFRAPAGVRNCFLDPVMRQFGLTLVSWTRRGFDTRRALPRQVLRRLTQRLAAGDILLLHDGNAGLSPSGEPLILSVLPALIERCRAAGLRPVRLVDALH
ncbi:polysaccharide deacetylase family protein [Ideonella sp.]|uniref:polysaccharide deacetylase family protein n=1 Tax=Ideonella sp. TaxID=1929293 RepID=UPI0035B1E8E3